LVFFISATYLKGITGNRALRGCSAVAAHKGLGINSGSEKKESSKK
jgi:hypothetical protein